MRFYLGTHETSWLTKTDVPLFISRRRLEMRKQMPRAIGPWALDSGGFTELELHGRWVTTEQEYVASVRRYAAEIGGLEWVAPMDWMCEPFMLERTGLSVGEHQRRTVDNFRVLREELGRLVIPVLQGWTLDDYMLCWEMYHRAGVELEWEDRIGLGTVCRRQNTSEVGVIVRALAELTLSHPLHGFGIKKTGLESYSDALGSADSLAWSYRARNDWPLAGCTHKSCANCLRYALRWRDQVLARLGQQRLEVVCPAV